MGLLDTIQNNPEMMLALGAGLLQGGSPGGTLGSGVQQGFQNYLQMGQATRQRRLIDAQTAELERKKAAREAATTGIMGMVGQPQRTIESPVFKTGVNEQPATGLYAQDPQQAKVLGLLAESDPSAALGLLGKQAFPEKGKMRWGKVSIDSLGRPWAINMDTNKYEMIPGGTETRLKTVQGTDPTGMPVTQLVNPALFEQGTQRITTGKSPVPYKLSPGFMLKDPSDPAKGVIPIPGGPKARFPGETASKKAMLRGAMRFLPTIDKTLFSGGNVIRGKINRSALAESAAERILPGALLPEGQQLNNAYEYGIQAITRTETGAAMPAEEVKNTRIRFQPSFTDSDRVIRQKRLAYELFLNDATKYMDPQAPITGNWNVDVDAALSDAEKKLGTVGKSDILKQADEIIGR